MWERLWARPSVLYKGYVDDARNTDNAWLERAVYHFHSDAAQTTILASGRLADGALPQRRWADLRSLIGDGEVDVSHRELLIERLRALK